VSALALPEPLEQPVTTAQGLPQKTFSFSFVFLLKTFYDIPHIVLKLSHVFFFVKNFLLK